MSVSAGTASGLTVRLQDTNAEELPGLTLVAGRSNSLILELANSALTDSLPILSWQLGLRIGNSETATGSVVFASVTSTGESLFGNENNLQFGDLLTTDNVVSDADSGEFEGAVVAAQSATPIVTLSLMPSIDADGMFALWATSFGEDDQSSYWIDAQDFMLRPFDNPVSAAQRIELATIHVIGSRGDFNNDTQVDAADYTVWRNGLGTEFLPVHYDIWKQHFGEDLADSAAQAIVPEPTSFWLEIIGLLFIASYRVARADEQFFPS
jgi:hypothetical protein